MKYITSFVTLVTLPSLAFAHGDHGHNILATLEHVLSQPLHLWPLLVALALGVALLRRPLGQLIARLRNKG